MRYIIIGAGGVGGTIGARLFESGHEVVLVARGAHHAALTADGLRFATPDGTRTLRIPVADRPESLELRTGDVLVLAVKTQDTLAALEAWRDRPVAGGGTAAGELPLVCAQNGVESERLAARRFRHVYGMCVWLPASHLEPGAIEAAGAPLSGILHLGRYPSGTDETAERVSTDLDKSVFLAPVSADVMRWKYGKLLGNLGNAVEALCGPGDEAAGLHGRARDEGAKVLAAAGIGYASAEEAAERRGELVQLEPVGGVRRGGGSSWQSLTRGTGSIEADYLNGEIVMLGRRHGVPAPVNEVLQREANRFARLRRAPGGMTPTQLLALIDG
ncbi:MAG: 2-dehydropantoate 2-reductase [Streptosporangiaceae bacterium]|nr:2-dehydropantoate 2-reductase [Streptosporangiaceae bacterium]MDX6432830.1 2-dehydropantoate 2-reductase [Streptosporangiaceae bacterium]